MIGKQAEACFEAYLRQSEHYELLISNIQIQGETETLGEMDYIVENLQTNQVIHIELACKFFLYDVNATVSEEEKWMGPNRKDSLYDKLEKIQKQQFPILHIDETIQTLKRLNIEIPSIQELCLKAFLFIPKEMNAEDFSKNYQECIVGFWMRPQDFHEQDKTALYAIPDKRKWLLPTKLIDQWYSFSEIKVEIEKHIEINRSPMVYKKTLNTIERIFIVWW